jgi:hypothetical protein
MPSYIISECFPKWRRHLGDFKWFKDKGPNKLNPDWESWIQKNKKVVRMSKVSVNSCLSGTYDSQTFALHETRCLWDGHPVDGIPFQLHPMCVGEQSICSTALGICASHSHTSQCLGRNKARSYETYLHHSNLALQSKCWKDTQVNIYAMFLK